MRETVIQGHWPSQPTWAVSSPAFYYRSSTPTGQGFVHFLVMIHCHIFIVVYSYKIAVDNMKRQIDLNYYLSLNSIRTLKSSYCRRRYFTYELKVMSSSTKVMIM